jgi:Xaa-Pro aminopeptidase
MLKLTQADFEARRLKLAHTIGPNSIVIIGTNPVCYRNSDVDYKYRADSSFYYLTGFQEPEAIAVIETSDTSGEYKYTLFCRERNLEMEIWNGYRAGLEGAKTLFNADESYVIESFEEKIVDKLSHAEKLYFRVGHDSDFDAYLANIIQKNNLTLTPLQLDSIVDEMRLIKSEKEIALMRKAAEISAIAHTKAMENVRIGMMEYELEAELHYIFGKNGCVPAYGSIVGSGSNGCVLHYVENNKKMEDGQLVLIDAGCEYEYYASDITRTFPVNGVFSKEQRIIYQLVLDAQLAAIDAVRIGNSYRKPHDIVVRILTQGLLELGLLQGHLDDLIADEEYRRFYMHGTGHWLGLDVHDVGAYKTSEGSRCFENGMVITIEPGIYISPTDKTVHAKWRGIGIRIEDDILVTAQGPQVLTENVVKEIDDIESLIKSAAI